MKTIVTTLAAALIAVTTFAGNGVKEKATHQVNAEKSAIFWTGKKVTGMHTGTLNLKGGEVMIENGEPVATTMIMDMKTIDVTDLQGDMKDRLKGHLNSDDFFGTETHPEAIFKSTSFTAIKGAQNRDANYMVKGNLTIKGITNEVEFPAFVAVRPDGVIANGKITLDRSKWEIDCDFDHHEPGYRFVFF